MRLLIRKGGDYQGAHLGTAAAAQLISGSAVQHLSPAAGAAVAAARRAFHANRKIPL
jgi:hypothetical protein